MLEKENTKYSYDEESNLIRKVDSKNGVWEYQWYDNGHLRKVKRPNGKEVSFTYDALGRRTAKTFEGKKTSWVWDGNVPVV